MERSFVARRVDRERLARLLERHDMSGEVSDAAVAAAVMLLDRPIRLCGLKIVLNFDRRAYCIAAGERNEKGCEP